MPTYCYACECGKKKEEYSDMSDFRKTIPCDCGKKMSIDMQAQHGEHRPVGDIWMNYESSSMSVLPEQLKDFREEDRRRGVGFMDYARMDDGCYTPKPRNANDWKRYRKAYGFFDKSGYASY